MIKSVLKELNGDQLKVTVHTKIKDFIVNPTRILNDQDIINIISKEYKIIKTISTPNAAVGNSIKRNIKQAGTWIFKIEIEPNETIIESPEEQKKETNNTPTVETEKVEKEPEPPPPKPRRRRRVNTKKSSTSSSLRDKMKNIAKQTKENT